MRTQAKWVDKIQDSDKVEQCIYDLCFKPDGSQLVVASGNRVLVYDTADGTLIQPLKGHKDVVYCVAYAKNGQKFASGSADKTVIVWSNKLEGLLKFSHSDAVQCLAFNPLTHQLASCSLSDYAFWTAEQKAVQKYKVSNRINSCSWTSDGQYLALGFGNGTVSIRNKLGEEKCSIQRPDSPSIWAISWNTYKDDPTDVLCVTDWNNTLSFYSLSGKLVGKERLLGFDALDVRYFPKGEYILISGTNKACNLYTRDGIKLGTVGDQQNSWIWCSAPHPSGNFVAMGCQDGTIAYYQLIFNTVHGLYKERYAFRENMTDVIIQHLLTEQKVRIKCRDLIKKIAIYKHRLAVQLPERIVVYELFSGDANDMHYRVKEKITQRLECSLLVVCADHLVVCQEKELRSLTFSGVNERDWSFESAIRYIKVVGGPPSKESLILGLKNGQVWQIHLDSSFPIQKVTVGAAIRCLDLSQNKEQLSVVDETGLCQVFNAITGELNYQEPNTNSTVWNTQFEDMIAFSGNNTLSIKVADFPAHSQRLVGFVVGLTGSKVFCLNGSSMATLELPLSAPMYQYIERKMYSEAHKVACLGVTNGDWEELAFAALEDLELEIARLAFIRLQNYVYLELISDIEECQHRGENNNDVFIGDIYAMRGKFKEAARLYKKAGHPDKALNMYTDLRMFDLAQEYLDAGDNLSLVRQKAEWAKNINEHKAAAEMFLSIGDTQAAVNIMGEQGWTEQLADLGRRLDKADRSVLISIAEHLKRLNDSASASELFRKLGDSAAVLQLHVEAKEWQQAFNLVQTLPQYKALVYVPYAHYLAENDKFVQAQKAFHMAGHLDEAFTVLHQLTDNAVTECRFQDAGYYYWILSRQCLDLAQEDQENSMLIKFHENEHLANVYYAYNALHRYLEDPFTSYMPEALFNIARFLMAQTALEIPKGVSSFSILYTLAKQARTLGANKLAKQLFDKIQTLRVPAKFQELVEISTIAARARSYSDPEELLPMCYRCSTYNPLAANSTKCINCGEKFVYSFVSFEILPLVEFQIENDISDLEAIRLIEAPADVLSNTSTSRWKQEITETHEALQLDVDIDDVDNPFTTRLINFEDGDGDYRPVLLNRKLLLSIESSSVLICKKNAPLPYQYFHNLLPDVQIVNCTSCFKFFHVDDFELQVLQKGFCPFCRVPPENMSTHNLDLSEDILMVRNYIKKGSAQPKYSEEQLQRALDEIRAGTLAVYKASVVYKVPFSTLYCRSKGTRGRIKKSKGRKTALPENIENTLAASVKTLAKWGFGLGRKEIMDMVGQYVNGNTLETPFKDGIPGEDWFLNFKRRHNLSIRKPETLEYARKNAATDPFTIYGYFDLLKKTLTELNLEDKPQCIWNLDESSLSIDPSRTKVVGEKGQSSSRVTSTSGRENTTFVLAASAAGQRAPPLIIYKGKNMWDQWRASPDKEYPRTSYAASPNGWMETEIFINYFKKTLIPALGAERPVLILYDGHATHVSVDLIETALAHGITILKLPPHTSDRLQPLDLSVFRSFKQKWDEIVSKWQRQNIGQRLPKSLFSQFLGETWLQVSEDVIKSGFIKGGIYPFNPNVIPREHFSKDSLERWEQFKQQNVNEESEETTEQEGEVVVQTKRNEEVSSSENNAIVPIPSTSRGPDVQPIINKAVLEKKSIEDILLSTIHQKGVQNKLKKRKVASGAEVITSDDVLKILQEKDKNKKNKKNSEKDTQINKITLGKDTQNNKRTLGKDTQNNKKKEQT